MKKWIKSAMIFIFTCALLCACGGAKTGGTAVADTAEEAEDHSGGTFKEESGGQEEEKPQQTEEPELKAEDFVGEQFTFSGIRGSEDMGYTTEVIYLVPKLLPETAAAKAINEDIYIFCLDVIEPTQDELDFPTWYNVGYEVYLNGDILSLVITKDCTMDDARSSAVFNYNVKTESVINNTALLKSCGYTEAAFVRQMRKAVAYEADNSMQYLFGTEYWNSKDTDWIEQQNMYAECMRYRQNSIATDRVNAQMPMYLDEAGELKVFAEIDTPAGAGFYQTILSPRTESGARDFELSFEDSLFLTYKDGVMTIRVEEGDWTKAAFGGAGSCLEFGREYTVDGVFKDYVDGEMQFVFEGEYAVPVFVSDDGMVSALNIYDCAPAGYFCLMEPVMGVTEIEAVTEVNGGKIAASVGETLLGQHPDFARSVLGIYGQTGFNKTYRNWSEETGIDTYDYYIGFDDQEEGLFLYQYDEPGHENYWCYTGECRLLGMNEDGLVFGTKVYADFNDPFDPDPHYSAFALIKHGRWNDLLGDFEEWADFRSLGGFITLDAPDDVVMTLEVTYG